MSVLHVQNPVRVSLIMMGGSLLITLMVVLARLAMQTHAVIEVTFFRNLVGCLCMTALIARGRGGFSTLKTKRPRAHVVRAVLGLIGLYLNFWAVTLLPLAEQTALFFAMPFMVTLLSIPLLHEKVDARRWVAVVLGFCGIIIMTRPTGDANWLGIFVALSGAFFTALVAIAIRSLGSSEPERRTVFYFLSIACVLSALFLPMHWTTPTAITLAYMVAAGVVGTAGQLMMTRAHALAPAAFLSPFHYLSIIYSTLFGWLIWDEWPHMAVFVGAGVVIMAGFLNIGLEKTRPK